MLTPAQPDMGRAEQSTKEAQQIGDNLSMYKVLNTGPSHRLFQQPASPHPDVTETAQQIDIYHPSIHLCLTRGSFDPFGTLRKERLRLYRV